MMADLQHKTHLRNYLQSHKTGQSPEKPESNKRKSPKQSRPPASAQGSNPHMPTNSSASNQTSTSANLKSASSNQTSASAHRTFAKLSAGAKNNRTVKTASSKQNLFSTKLCYSKTGRKTDIECLPEEVLLEIFEYFSPQDLLNCARVCKRWHYIASDNLLWQNIYKQYATKAAAASQSTTKNRGKENKPKQSNVNIKVPQNPPASFWKSFCVQSGAEFRNNRALNILEKKKLPTSPFTGLPKGTQEALLKSGVRWVLCFVDVDDREHTVFSNDAFYFHMSVCVRWYSFTLPSLHRIRRLRLYAGNPIFFDDSGQAVWNSPLQKSLLYDREFKFGEITSKSNPLGTDNVVNVFKLEDGVSIGTWKDGSDIAYLSMSLHAHCLVKRCLYGKGDQQWAPPRHKIFKDDIDVKYGLHSYSCTLELRNMRNSFWSQQFPKLNCQDAFQDGYAVMQLIDPDRSYERSWIEKKICLPWKTEALKGIVKDTGLLDVTVLDDQGSPVWCSNGLINIEKSSETNAVTYEYEGDYSVINYSDPNGKVQMVLIWEEPSKKFYITSLQLHLSLQLINKWFGRKY